MPAAPSSHSALSAAIHAGAPDPAAHQSCAERGEGSVGGCEGKNLPPLLSEMFCTPGAIWGRFCLLIANRANSGSLRGCWLLGRSVLGKRLEKLAVGHGPCCNLFPWGLGGGQLPWGGWGLCRRRGFADGAACASCPQEEMTSALATMRVDYEQIKIKKIEDSSNPLLMKRRKKANPTEPATLPH